MTSTSPAISKARVNRRSRYYAPVSNEGVGPPIPGATEVEIHERVSVYSPVTNSVVMLNETAGDVWRLVDGARSLEEIISLLAAAYGVESASIAADVASAIDSFVAAGLLAGTSPTLD